MSWIEEAAEAVAVERAQKRAARGVDIGLLGAEERPWIDHKTLMLVPLRELLRELDQDAIEDGLTEIVRCGDDEYDHVAAGFLQLFHAARSGNLKDRDFRLAVTGPDRSLGYLSAFIISDPRYSPDRDGSAFRGMYPDMDYWMACCTVTGFILFKQEWSARYERGDYHSLYDTFARVIDDLLEARVEATARWLEGAHLSAMRREIGWFELAFDHVLRRLGFGDRIGLTQKEQSDLLRRLRVA